MAGTTSEQEAAVVVFRRPGMQVTFGLFIFLWVPLPCLVATLSPYVAWWGRVLTGLAFIPAAVLIGRISALAICAGPHDLVIRNLRNNHRIPWSEVEDIYVTPPIPLAVYRETALPNTHKSLLVRLKEGAVISATLYDDRMFNSSRSRAGSKARIQAAERLKELWRERSDTVQAQQD